MQSDTPPSTARAVADWLGINRATLAVLIAIGGLGLSEEIWRNFFGIQLKEMKGHFGQAALYLGIYGLFENLLEGFGYILGGKLAHRLGPGIVLALSAIPTALGFALMLTAGGSPWIMVVGALLVSNWEPLSVPATFDVVGSEVPKGRRTIAFAMQSINKRLPKVIGPLIGSWAFLQGYNLNLTLAWIVLGISIILQLALLKRLKPKAEGVPVPMRELLARIPPDLRQLLNAEILLRWGDWFVRDFAGLYVVYLLAGQDKPALEAASTYAHLIALTAFVALLTYIPMGKLIDRARSPKPFIGMTFILFALFPFCLVLLPKTGMPLMWALGLTFVLNGLREIGEPARKALIASGMPPEIRARAIGLYWGLRSLAFCPAPIIAALLWMAIGPEWTFLIGGCIGLAGNVWFWMRVKAQTD